MNCRLLVVAAGLALFLATTPASALITTLSFEGSVCGVSGTQACGDGSQIGAQYGDSAEADVSYRTLLSNGAENQSYLKYWETGYGDLTGVVWGGGNATSYKAEIRIEAMPGFLVSLLDFDAGCYNNAPSCQLLKYELRDLVGNLLASSSSLDTTPSGANSHADVVLNTSYYSGFVLTWGPDAYNLGLDNIRFETRGTSISVPEPASLALLGLGLAGLGVARRWRRAE